MKCPLCQQELLEIRVGVECDYICRVRVKFEGCISVPHYEHRHGYPITWYLPPFQVVLNPNQTIVNKFEENDYYRGSRFSHPYFTHLFTTEEPLRADSSEKLINRIKLLTVFS